MRGRGRLVPVALVVALGCRALAADLAGPPGMAAGSSLGTTGPSESLTPAAPVSGTLLLPATAGGSTLTGAATGTTGPVEPIAAAPVPPAMATVTGVIHELGSPDPVSGAVVSAGGTVFVAETDEHGRFAMAVGAGRWVFSFQSGGYAPVERTLTLTGGEIVDLRVALKRVLVQTADEIVVHGRHEAEQVSQTTITHQELMRIPGTAGDALRAVQSLPGVASPNDFSGRMAVRGGGPNDNLYLIDNIPWPVPFHFGGVVSTVNSDLLTAVDLYAAGFDARWGNADGAVLDARTRPGRKDRFHATADINMVTSEALLEGPAGFGDASWTLSGRRSYFDLILGPFIRRRADTTITALPRFWDLGGSFDVSLSPHDHLHVIGLATDDLLGVVIPSTTWGRDSQFNGEFRLHNAYETVGASWVNDAVPGLHSTFTPYGYQFEHAMWVGSGYGLTVRVNVFGAKEELAWDLGSTGALAHTLEFGAGVENEDDHAFGYFFRRTPDRQAGTTVFSDPTSTTVTGQGINRSAYVQDRIAIGKDWTVKVGGHYDQANRIGATGLTPRLSLEWRSDRDTTWRAAWGDYDQFPTGQQINPEFGNPSLGLNYARHAVLGVERALAPGTIGKLEVYDKEFRNLVVNVTDDRLYANDGIGFARGVELFLKQNVGEKFFGWLAYSYSTSQRKNEPTDAWTLYRYDQPNIATAIASYRVTPTWTLGAKLHWNSGPLVTPLLGRRLNSDGSYTGIFGPSDSQRLSDYVRLDLRVEHSWLYESWKINGYLEVLNALDRANPEGVEYNDDYTKATRVNNLPLLPYFGIGVEF